ncbi:MAG: hypothetical protein AAES65_16110 [Candidatus Thiodiazotropha sp. (ex. Lucinoma kazani)]
MLYLSQGREDINFGILALFTSIGTLICCALPILLVVFGLGSVVAAVTLQLPFLVTLSEYKAAMFATSALLLVISGWFVFRKAACPTIPVLAARCQKASLLGKRIFYVAGSFWLIGLVSAYLLLPIRQWIDI